MPIKKKTAPSETATGSTKITLTLPDDLLAVLDAAAARDNRTRSNLIAHWLRGIKEAHPCLAKALTNPQPRKPAGPPGPCPQGHTRPCERSR